MLYTFTVHYVTTANIQLYQGMFTVLLAARSSHGSRVTRAMQSLVIPFRNRQICSLRFAVFWRGYFGYCWTTSFPSLPPEGEKESESLGTRLISGIIFSDQLEFSPNNITEYIIKRTDDENYKMSHHQMENALIFYKILSTNFLKKRMGYQCGEFTCGYRGFTG